MWDVDSEDNNAHSAPIISPGNRPYVEHRNVIGLIRISYLACISYCPTFILLFFSISEYFYREMFEQVSSAIIQPSLSPNLVIVLIPQDNLQSQTPIDFVFVFMFQF